MVGSQWESNIELATTDDHLIENKTFYIMNPGTERAAVAVCVAGNVGSGISIYNKATGQSCSIVGLTDENTTDVEKYLKCDALNGQTTLVGGSSIEPAFKYHREGFVELESSYPVIRNVLFTTTSGSNSIECDIDIDESLKGQRMYFDNGNLEANIVNITGTRTIVVDRNATASGTFTGCIMPVNEIYVYGDEDFDLSLLRLDFSPTFA